MKEMKSEIPEIKSPQSENYKEIKPQTNVTPDEARDFIDSMFNKMENVNEHFDDNGKLYRVDNDLVPNNQYELNQYKYKTDNQGRVISAEGKLQIKNHEGRIPIKDDIKSIGKGDERETDQKGHLIADRFNGSPDLGNLVAQDGSINMGSFKKFEADLAKQVDLGKDVRVKVEPIYDGDSRRPTDICYTYSIDGKITQVIFPNGKE